MRLRSVGLRLALGIRSLGQTWLKVVHQFISSDTNIFPVFLAVDSCALETLTWSTCQSTCPQLNYCVCERIHLAPLIHWLVWLPQSEPSDSSQAHRHSLSEHYTELCCYSSVCLWTLFLLLLFFIACVFINYCFLFFSFRLFTVCFTAAILYISPSWD